MAVEIEWDHEQDLENNYRAVKRNERLGGNKGKKGIYGSNTNVSSAELAYNIFKQNQNSGMNYMSNSSRRAIKKTTSSVLDQIKSIDKNKKKSASENKNAVAQLLANLGVNNAYTRLGSDFGGSGSSNKGTDNNNNNTNNTNNTNNNTNNTNNTNTTTTSSSTVNAQIDELNSALAAALAAINAMSTGYNTQTETQTNQWPGAPDWVKNFEDYRKWLRMKSSSTGYLSTLNTSSTGMSLTDYIQNVNVTTLGT